MWNLSIISQTKNPATGRGMISNYTKTAQFEIVYIDYKTILSIY